MYDAQHPKSDVDKLYIWKSRGWFELIIAEDCVGMEISSLDNYLMTTGEKLLMWVKNFEEEKNKEKENVP